MILTSNKNERISADFGNSKTIEEVKFQPNHILIKKESLISNNQLANLRAMKINKIKKASIQPSSS